MKNTIEIPKEFNVHHTWYWKSDYKKRYEKQFRNYLGFLIPTPVSNHRMVHRELFLGAPKPPRDEMGDCLDYLDDIHPSQKTDRFWGVEGAQRFFIIKEFENEAETDRYQETRLHLSRQIGILTRKLSGVEFPTIEELYRYGKAE